VKYGYARISTVDQNADMQLKALQSAGIERKIFKDELSGATTNRPALQRCLKKLGPGDTLTVWKMDRLGRSLRDLITMLDGVKQRGVINSGPSRRQSTPRRRQAAPCGK
jgi:DNA invertase Pin-like site-specific DNA recombinase